MASLSIRIRGSGSLRPTEASQQADAFDEHL